jgi:Do/DeqQ family serine protease
MRKSLILVLPVFLAACGRQPSTTQASNLPTEPPSISSNAPQSYAPLVKRVAPAVVTVRSSRRVRPAQQYPFQNDPFFRWFFGGGAQGQRFGNSQQPQVERALGSGVLVEQDGHILTNQHVIDGATEIHVDLTDGRTFPAKLVGQDQLSDLAVLKIDASNLPVLYMGDSNKVQVGDVVLAVGNPLAVGETVTNGIISAKGRYTGLSNGSFEDFLQTDAPINQGNSGGALVNTNGELIGINSQILSTTGGFIGIGFAIPSNMAKSVMTQLAKSGKVERGQLGVTAQQITSQLAQSLGLQNVQGVLVSQVTPGSAADKAGIKPGDVITEFNGQKVLDPNTFRNTVASTAPGTEVTITYIRDGHPQQAKATLQELKPQQPNQQQEQGQQGHGQLGLTVQPMSPAIAQQLNLPPDTQGVVVTNVDPSGPGADAGIQQGDVIEQVNREPVKSAADIQSALAKSQGRPALVLINRGGQTLFVSVGAAQ